jgi:hypothetical protein
MEKETKKKYRKMLVEIVTIYYIEHKIQYDKMNTRDAHWKNSVLTGACLGSVIIYSAL